MGDLAERDYRGFLLRTWEEAPGRPGGRRYSLEDPATGRRHGFASAADLVRFLAAVPASGEPPIVAPHAPARGRRQRRR